MGQDKLDCNYWEVTVGDRAYLILSLGWAPTQDKLDWADKIIKANPDKNVIVTTHAFMYWDGTHLNDEDLDYGLGMMMLLTFHEGSDQVDVNWYSAEEGKLFRTRNQFSITVPHVGENDGSGSGGSSSGNERTYAIVTGDNGHGSVTVSADEASAGTRITVTVKPDAGYELDELTVTDAKNKDLKVTKRSETTYTFHMADSKVTVEASFTKDGTVQKPDTRFDDVAKSAWYYKAVEYVAENGIMSGVSAREFAPNAGFSRAMLAQTLYAMSGKPTVKAEGTFADVAANAWYADAVNWAAEKGYVSGVGDGKFAPDASITREQMALILYRYAGSPDASGMVLREFADGDSVSAYAVDAIRWAVHEGLISGMENNTLAPQGTATRAQVAQILMNFHQKLDK